MGIKAVFLVAILIGSVIASSQNILVYHASGNVVILNGSSKTPALKGSLIGKTSSLQITGSGTCMLIGQKGLSVQISKPGYYTYSRIQQLISTAKTQTVSANFFAYVYDNVVYKKEKTSLNVTPVVYRAEALMKSPQQYGFSVAGKNIVFAWRQPASKSPVHFQLLSYTDSVIIDTVFNREQLTYVLSDQTKKVVPGVIYKWNAEEAYNRAKVTTYYFFKVVKKGDSANFSKAWKYIDGAGFTKEATHSLKQDLLLQGSPKN